MATDPNLDFVLRIRFCFKALYSDLLNSSVQMSDRGLSRCDSDSSDGIDMAVHSTDDAINSSNEFAYKTSISRVKWFWFWIFFISF